MKHETIPELSRAHLRMIGYSQRIANINYFESGDGIFIYYHVNKKRWDWSMTSLAGRITEAQTIVATLNRMDAKHNAD